MLGGARQKMQVDTQTTANGNLILRLVRSVASIALEEYPWVRVGMEIKNFDFLEFLGGDENQIYSYSW